MNSRKLSNDSNYDRLLEVGQTDGAQQMQLQPSVNSAHAHGSPRIRDFPGAHPAPGKGQERKS